MANIEESSIAVMNNNSSRWYAQSSRPGNNQRLIEIKTWVIQLLHANPFIGMDHEDPINYPTKMDLVDFYYCWCNTSSVLSTSFY